MYVPKVGDAIAARRKLVIDSSKALIVGPVVEVWDGGCRVVTNPGTDYSGDFSLSFDEWMFQYLGDA